MLKSHQTYPAAECLDCHKVSLRICITHDKCEFGNRIENCGGHF